MQIDIDKAARAYFPHLTLTYGRLAVKAGIDAANKPRLISAEEAAVSIAKRFGKGIAVLAD